MIWLIFLAGFLNLFLGILVWSREPKNRLNYFFGIFCSVAAITCFSDFIFRFQPTLIFLKTGYAFAALIPATASIWIMEICQVPIRLNKFKVLLLLPGLLFFVISYIDKLIVKEVYFLSFLGYKGELGPFFFYYAIYFLIYALSLILLVYFNQRVASGLQKKQLRFILFGISSYGTSAIFFSIVLPSFFNIYNFTLLDAPSSILFVVFTAYAILKHHFLNIKVIATEIFAFAISLILLVNVFLSESTIELFSRITLFIAVSIFGWLLIKSVLNEVKSREKIAEMAEKLQKANVDLRKLDKAKSEFISIASHQLRTPLSIIKGFVSMLLEGTYGELPDRSKEVLAKIATSNERLNRLINDLLDLSRMEGGQMKFDWEFILLTDLVQNVIDELAPQSEKKKIELRWNPYTEKMYVRADKEKLRHVIMNLIDNAIKYTPQGYVEVKLEKTVKGMAQLSIKDTGIGMDKEDMQVIFGKFIRGKKVPRLWTEGVGLGLYVARKILEEHQGRIWAESQGEGKGSTFYVELPVY